MSMIEKPPIRNRPHAWSSREDRCIRCGITVADYEDSSTPIPCIPIKKALEDQKNDNADSQ